MDDYTPFGYLDNAWHSGTHPSGVVRCQPAIGFAWHFPALRGPYVRHWLYRAALRLALLDAGRPLLTSEQLNAIGVNLVSRFHSQHIMSFDWQYAELDCSAAFFLSNEHALCTRLIVTNKSPRPATVGWAFVAEYERNVGAANAWDCGLCARYDSTDGSLKLLAYPEGEAFCLRTDRAADDFGVATYVEGLFEQSRRRDAVSVTPTTQGGPALIAGCLSFMAPLRPGETIEMLATLARGCNERNASRTASVALSGGPKRLAQVVAEHHASSQSRPTLSGDWPAHWRRGFVYDFDSLRCIVRQPRGVFRRQWDGMQIQSPRLVLAESALDALVLGYADISTAQELLLGAFLNSRAPNAPCVREDGSHNMVAEDGESCGTAPEWCFPIYCADLLYRRSGDRRWLAHIYQRLSRYLAWWLQHRSDATGWLHYHCSWESGQDDSPRFGPQDGGGSLVKHIRPVDLHAAVAQGAAILSRFAAELARPKSAARWSALAGRYTAMTRSLFHDGWFRDFDTRTGQPSSFRDVMHLAPLLAGVADDEQRAALRHAFDDLPPHGIWAPMDWPPVVFTVLEAACSGGWHQVAGRLAEQVVDRVYRAYDQHAPAKDAPLPGIASERWASTGSWGCEGYGWGALGALLVIRHVAGFHEEPNGEIALHPVLPDSWLAEGRRFVVGHLRYRGRELELHLVPTGNGLAIELRGVPREKITIRDSSGQAVSAEPAGSNAVSWRAPAGTSFRIEVNSLW